MAAHKIAFFIVLIALIVVGYSFFGAFSLIRQQTHQITTPESKNFSQSCFLSHSDISDFLSPLCNYITIFSIIVKHALTSFFKDMTYQGKGLIVKNHQNSFTDNI